MQLVGLPPSRSLAYGMNPSCIPMVCNFWSTFSGNVRSFGLELSGNLELLFCFPCLVLLLCIALLFIGDEGCCFDSIVFCYPLLYVLSVCNSSLFQFSKWPVCMFSCLNKVTVSDAISAELIWTEVSSPGADLSYLSWLWGGREEGLIFSFQFVDVHPVFFFVSVYVTLSHFRSNYVCLCTF